MNARALTVGTALAVAAGTAIALAQAPAANTVDGLVSRAKETAGLEWAGTFMRLCIPPPPAARARRGAGERDTRSASHPGQRRVVRRARESRGQLLLPRNEGPQRLGARRQRRHHPVRSAVRLRGARRDRRRDAEARSRHQQGQVHGDFTRARRSRRRRAVPAGQDAGRAPRSTAVRTGTRSISRPTVPAASRSATWSAPMA